MHAKVPIICYNPCLFKKSQKINPFKINKKGFEVMVAWLTFKDIKSIKLNAGRFDSFLDLVYYLGILPQRVW